MSETIEENSSKKSKESKDTKSFKNEEEEQIYSEEEISEDKYQLQQNPNSNILSNKLIKLIHECLLDPVNKFNKDCIYEYDKEKILDKKSIDSLDIEINNYKISFIEEQYKIIKELIAKYDLINNLKNFSDEKIFSQELNKYDINTGILSFIGPLSKIINEINKKEGKDDLIEIEQFLFEILEKKYYAQKIIMVEENIKLYKHKIQELKDENKIQ